MISAAPSVPDVSVVMGVYNGVDSLDLAVESILSQEGVELELIVVDDGSSDGSSEALDRWAARDPRIVVVHQQNAGLTVSLQRACALAKAGLIARQDAGGDRSLSGRLKSQVDALRGNEAAVAVSGDYRLVAMDGTALCEISTTRERIKSGLAAVELPEMRGILHASSMFRADAFRKVGGYRAVFPVAQDLDLWLRLYEVGEFEYVDQLIYDVRHDAGSISSTRRAEQVAAAEFAGSCAKARRAGLQEPIASAQGTLPASGAVSERECRASYHYFVGACLRQRDARAARSHFLRAWRAKPSMVKALLLAATTW